MRIAVLGAVGVGSYYGGTLARAGHAVTLLARGVHLNALRVRGLEVRTPEDRFTVAVQATDDPKAFGACDVAIVAAKTYSLAEIAPTARLLAEGGAASRLGRKVGVGTPVHDTATAALSAGVKGC